jgi:hypothetical protein
MRYLALALGVVPGLIGFAMDPDLLGMIFLAVYLLASYTAWRTRIAGGIVLVLVGAIQLALFLINLLGPHHWGPMDILAWAAFIVSPVAGGLLFIATGKNRGTIGKN